MQQAHALPASLARDRIYLVQDNANDGNDDESGDMIVMMEKSALHV